MDIRDIDNIDDFNALKNDPEITFYRARQIRIRFDCDVCGRETIQRLRNSVNLICFRCNRNIKDFGQLAVKESKHIYEVS